MLKKLVFISIFSFLLLLKVTSVSAEDGGIETQTPPNLPYCTTRLLLVQELFSRNGTLITGYGTTLDSCTKAVRAQTTVCLESPNQQPSINQMCLDAIAKTTDPAKPAPLNQATIIDPKRPCRDDDFTSYINRADFNNAHYDTVENCQNTVYNEIQTFNTLNAHCDLTPDQKSKIGKYCEAGVKSGNFDEKTLATPAPNAVPTDVPGCGLKDNVCCKGDPTQIKAGELKSSKENCFFICLADLFNFIGGIFTNSLGDENKTKLDQFGFCYNVEPTTGAQLNLLPTFNSADSNAICTCKEVSGDVEAYHLCDQYIATAYNTIKNPKDKERTADEYRSCVACSIGVPV